MRIALKIAAGLIALMIVAALIPNQPPRQAPSLASADALQAAQLAADQTLIRSAQDQALARLRDPRSAQFGNVIVSRGSGGPVVCGAVNAKNGFGGYTGHKLFVMPAGGSLVSEEDVSAKTFASLWTSSKCEGD